MDIFQIECILAIAQYRSFTKAAEAVHISQPALSQLVVKVEEELGVKLFERSTRYVYLTMSGNEFLEHALTIQQEYNMAVQKMKRYHHLTEERLSVGACNTITYYKLIDLITSFNKQYPQIQINLLEADSRELYHLLQRSQLDIAFAQVYSTDIDNISHKVLANDEVVLLVSSLHRLASQETIKLENARNEKFIFPEQDSLIYKECMKVCSLSGFTPNIVCRCTNIVTMVELALNNFGIAMLSKRIAMSHLQRGVTMLMIEPTVHGSLSLAYRSSDAEVSKIATFINYSTQWLDSLKNKDD